MKYIKTYQKHTEGIKTTMAGLGLAGLLMGSPDVKADSVKTPIEQINPDSFNEDDVSIVKQQGEVLSNIRKQNCTDTQLSAILDEIKDNVNSNDTAKLSELFTKLSNHMDVKYGYKIKQQNISQLDDSKKEKLKEPTELSLLEMVGWLGSILLAICGVPQAWASYKDKHSHGISWAFLLLWTFGELFTLAYVYKNADLPLLVNYGFNILVLGLILYYKRFPDGEANLDDNASVG